jgi:hypothetical protein
VSLNDAAEIIPDRKHQSMQTRYSPEPIAEPNLC